MATDMNNSQTPSAPPSEAQRPKKQHMMIKVAPPISLPQTLTAYCDPEEPSSKFYLGDSSNRKMFAVTTHGGLTGDRKSIRVYTGPSTDDPLLSEAIPEDESRLIRTPETEDIPEAYRPNPPCRWKKTPKANVSERRYPYEYKLYPEQTGERSSPEEESPLSGDHTVTKEEAEPIAVVSWKRLGHKTEPFKFRFLIPERGSYVEDKWRPNALLSGLSRWSRRGGSLPPETASPSHAP
ncbi:hypothetical protein CEP52_005885 [Fusarium oligoseptatum]|uniref:Uncharacterized protein n=1 Tax=Fusarium oligoseptatum TaxID=2604345 RepID=A0A428TVQ7_9HYPO|nr:hypothetical protein CEP52_005885 [Fusarium oligoseptatum]